MVSISLRAGIERFIFALMKIQIPKVNLKKKKKKKKIFFEY